MKIAVNSRLLQKNKLEGIGTFMDEVLQRIVRANPTIEFHFIFDRVPDSEFIYAKNVISHVIFPPTKHVLLYKLWFDFQLPKLLRKIGADCFLSLDAITSTNLSIPNHIVIHDINFVHRPQDLPVFPRNYYRTNTPKFCNSATKIATVSEYSKQDIMQTYGLKSDQIDVVFNAAKSCFKPITNKEKQTIKRKYSGGENYFLYVGSLHARKNLNNLILGFNAFKTANMSTEKLLIVGKIMWETKGLQKVLNECEHKNDIIFTGRKSDEELAKILAASIALSYVPFFEGFGIPIVEAYAAGVPVITSTTTCLPEIAGNGALYADPSKPEEIAIAMGKITNNESLREQLIQNGQKINQQYSWDKTANLYWESVKKIIF